MTEVYHRALKYSKHIYETGMPRNDIFFQDRPDILNKVREHYGIEKDVKIILYAPTFRPDGKFTYYDVDLNTIKTNENQKKKRYDKDTKHAFTGSRSADEIAQ